MTEQTEQISQKLENLQKLLWLMREVPPSYVACLAMIAACPGISINELAERLATPQQTVSRYVGILLARYEDVVIAGSRRPLIVQTISEVDPRKRALQITAQGKQFLAGLLDFIN
jgi:DNA-binding MarR family transcriptional regulator